MDRVALLAAIAHLRAVQVGVAGSAIVTRFSENRIEMASLARDVGMHAAQRVIGLLVVIEFRVRTNGFPGGSRMTRIAGD